MGPRACLSPVLLCLVGLLAALLRATVLTSGHRGPETTPQDVAARVSRALSTNPAVFINWEAGWQYGSTLTFDGLYEAAIAFPTTAPALDSAEATLPRYATPSPAAGGNDPSVVACNSSQPYGASRLFRDCAWAVTNPAAPQLPWQGTVSDHLGIFPIVYVSRYCRDHRTHDLLVAMDVAERYVLAYPQRLPGPGGPFARTGGWAGQPETGNATFLWADDQVSGRACGCATTIMMRATTPLLPCHSSIQPPARAPSPPRLNRTRLSVQFMGLALISRLARFGPVNTRRRYAMFAADMLLAFAARLVDPADGLASHGVNAATGAHSCCKWGRANGWGLMAHAEVLAALDALPPNRSDTSSSDITAVAATAAVAEVRARLVQSLQVHVTAMLAVQDGATGRWHQVLNDTSTYLVGDSRRFLSDSSRGRGCTTKPATTAICALLRLSPPATRAGDVGHSHGGARPQPGPAAWLARHRRQRHAATADGNTACVGRPGGAGAAVRKRDGRVYGHRHHGHRGRVRCAWDGLRRQRPRRGGRCPQGRRFLCRPGAVAAAVRSWLGQWFACAYSKTGGGGGGGGSSSRGKKGGKGYQGEQSMLLSDARGNDAKNANSAAPHLCRGQRRRRRGQMACVSPPPGGPAAGCRVACVGFRAGWPCRRVRQAAADGVSEGRRAGWMQTRRQIDGAAPGGCRGASAMRLVPTGLGLQGQADVNLCCCCLCLVGLGLRREQPDAKKRNSTLTSPSLRQGATPSTAASTRR